MPQRTTDEWIADLVEHDILFGKVNSPEDLMQDPHLKAVDMFPEVDHPTEGRLRMLGFPVNFSGTPQRLRHLPPTIGQHTRELLRELGYDDAAIDAMQARRALVAA